MRIAMWLLVAALAVVGWLAYAQQERVRESAANYARAQALRATPLPAPAQSFDPARVKPAAEARIAALPMEQSPAPPRSQAGPAPAGRLAPASDEGLACDGRTHCSQMRSCAEAQYFLAHCPGVKMDGNHDGEPCEQQFPECGR